MNNYSLQSSATLELISLETRREHQEVGARARFVDAPFDAFIDWVY